MNNGAYQSSVTPEGGRLTLENRRYGRWGKNDECLSTGVYLVVSYDWIDSTGQHWMVELPVEHENIYQGLATVYAKAARQWSLFP